MNLPKIKSGAATIVVDGDNWRSIARTTKRIARKYKDAVIDWGDCPAEARA